MPLELKRPQWDCSINGAWSTAWYDTEKLDGKFVREDAGFRHWVTADGSAGCSGMGGFQAESGRYHLYLSHACPWAHRAMIFRQLKALNDHVAISIVHPLMLENGWSSLTDEFATGDRLYGCEFLHQIYQKAQSDFMGRVTVPLLWDKKTQQIVSNESSEIIRMFNSAFDSITGNDLDLWPVAKREAIESVNDDVYHNINNGVYKAGFATQSSAYEQAVVALFDALDRIESRLTVNPYLMGNDLTEANWRLFTTLVRFDPVYVGHFKCNLRRISEYPALSNYLRELYHVPGIAETVVMPHIKTHYYASHRNLNPTGIVPKGPILDYGVPHSRVD
ncbi:glutathione S-transferase family protein [Candidatus Puniceispirillum sp.]|nr:glutathione S-transferase family protein [Candidatus Puniceispirillum sp.]